jgi:hypothetical protein
MELKNAVSVCLISLFAATLVVLIARSLDSQAASRLEPQLASIVEELHALRTQGGGAATATASAKTDSLRDGLLVYYFHGNIRCPTCRSIESQAEGAVQNHFAAQLKEGEVTWKIVNYEESAAKPLAEKFQIQMPVVVLAKVKNGQVLDWKRLDQVWALVGDKPAFAKYVREEIERMLPASKTPDVAADKPTTPDIPIPKTKSTPAKGSPALPLP